MTQGVAVKVLAALIALQVGVGGVALATVEEPARPSVAADASTTEPGSDPANETPTGAAPAPGEPAATPESPNPAGEPAPEATTPAAPAANLDSLPERPTPPRPGAYRYRSKFDGQFSAGTFTTQAKENRETTLRYETAPAVNGEARDRERTQQEGSNGGGMNFSGQADRERAWRQNGMFVTGEAAGGDSDAGSFEADCNWEPDVQELAFPLREGASWEWNSSCESSSENMDSKQTWRGAARVTGQKVASVGGKDVRVLVIERRSERTMDFTFRQDGRESRGSSTFQETTVQLYAPSVALSVRIDTDVKGTFESPGQPGGSGRFEGKSEIELLSLDPR